VSRTSVGPEPHDDGPDGPKAERGRDLPAWADTLGMAIAVSVIGVMGVWLGVLTLGFQKLGAPIPTPIPSVRCPDAVAPPGATVAISGIPAPATATPDPVTQHLQCEKLGLEIKKLEADVTSTTAWWTVVVSAVASAGTLGAVVVAIITFRRTQNADSLRRSDESDRHFDNVLEERFKSIVEGLGDGKTNPNVGSAAVLRLFAQDEKRYRPFHISVFTVAAAFSRVQGAPASTAQIPDPLTRELGRAIRDVYSHARERVHEQFPDANDDQRARTWMPGGSNSPSWISPGPILPASGCRRPP
jgi:hypothetical protein